MSGPRNNPVLGQASYINSAYSNYNEDEPQLDIGLRQLAFEIANSGGRHEILYHALLKIHHEIGGGLERRAHLVRHGFVPLLLDSINTAPTPDLRRYIIMLLKELTTTLEACPVGLTDVHFQHLTRCLTDNPEHLIDALHILQELTRLAGGRILACDSGVPRAVADIVSRVRNDEAVVPALRVLCNIAEDPTTRQGVVSTRVMSAYTGALRDRLLRHFHEQPFAGIDSITLRLMCQLEMYDGGEPGLRHLLQQLYAECAPFVEAALAQWVGVRAYWLKLQDLCI